MSPLTPDEIKEQNDKVAEARASIGGKPLPNGEPMPVALKVASHDLVSYCRDRLEDIERSLALPPGELDEAEIALLNQEREDIKKTLDAIIVANTGKRTTWEQFWNETGVIVAGLCNMACIGAYGTACIFAALVIGAGLCVPPIGIALAIGVGIVACIGVLFAGYAMIKDLQQMQTERQSAELETIQEINKGVVKDGTKTAKEELGAAKRELATAQNELINSKAQEDYDSAHQKVTKLSHMRAILLEQQQTLEKDLGDFKQKELLEAEKKNLKDNPLPSTASTEAQQKRNEDIRVNNEQLAAITTKLQGKTKDEQDQKLAINRSDIAQTSKELATAQNTEQTTKTTLDVKTSKVANAQARVAKAEQRVAFAEKRETRATTIPISPIGKAYQAAYIDPKKEKKPPSVEGAKPPNDSHSVAANNR